MPKNAEQFPLVGSFIAVEMAVTSIATIVSVGVMILHSHLQVSNITYVLKIR